MEKSTLTKFELEPDQRRDFEEIQKATGYNQDKLVHLVMELGIKHVREQIAEQETPTTTD